ncbi:MAG: bifunctional oligoribonuclease/PAP phosphatase NrnA [Clostridia bacterium]|nr:bifunctional oligoribonuclease/PAP phosphatase NrnA [Clostridia bacterium]
MPEAGPERGDWRRIVSVLSEARRVALLLHVRPDGDSVGSSLALARALAKLGKEVAVVSADDIPAALRFLPGAGELRRPEEVSGPFDVALLLDCGDLERTGPARRVADGAATVVNVDHHTSNTRFGDLAWIEPETAAVGEIAWRLVRELGVEPDLEIAYGIYTAIVTDTGSFGFSNTTPATHRVAAELLSLGVRPDEVARRVWEEKSEVSLRLLGRALASLTVEAGGRVAWVRVTQEDLAAVGASPDDAEGIVAHPRSLRGVVIAASFVEDAPRRWRVSLRSNGAADVAAIASRFGGGGHHRAAGLTLEGPFAEAARELLGACRQAAAGGGPDPEGAPA